MADVSYTPASTVAKLIASETFYNFIVGPVGPVSADTEYLTPTGWKRIDQYTPGDQLAQWTPDPGGNPTAGRMEFVAPLDYIVTPQTHFNHFRNVHSLSMVLSDSHRLVFYDYKGELKERPAGYVADHRSNRLIPTAFVPVDRPGTGMSEAVLRLAVAINADGHFPATSAGSTARPDTCLITVRKDRKKSRLRNLLAACGIDYNEATHSGRPTETVFSFRSPYVGKRYDAQWWGATAHELAVILEEMAHWDGLFEGEDTRFSTTHRGDADFMQYVAHACGGRATISAETPENPNWAVVYCVHIALAGSTKAAVRVRESTTVTRVPSEDGMQYCFRTPSTYFLARHNGRVFVTGNSGKSVGILFKILYHAKRQRPSPTDGIRRTRWVVVRNTMPQLKDTTIKSFFSWFPPGHAGLWISHTNSFVFQFDDVHCEVLFRPLDSPDDVGRVLSLEVTGAVLDEFVEIPKDIVEALSGRCGRFPPEKDGGPTWFGMWGASNPGNEDNWWFDWLYGEWNDIVHRDGTVEKGADAKKRLFTYFEQPSGLSDEAENIDNLPGGRAYYDNLVVGKTDAWIKQFVEVQWGYSLKGKPVWPAFNRNLHVAEKPLTIMAHIPVVIGFDAGLTPAAIIGQLDPFGRLLVLRELVSTGMGARRFCREKLIPVLTQLQAPGVEFSLVGDPAMVQRAQTDERTVAEVLREELRIPVTTASSNTLAARLGAVDDFLCKLTEAGPALVVDPQCKVLIRALGGGYRYAVNTKGNTADKPEKNDASHPADAFQYLCMGVTRVLEVGRRRTAFRLPQRTPVNSYVW